MARKLKRKPELNDLARIQEAEFDCVPALWLEFRPTSVQLPFLPSLLFGILCLGGPCNF